MNLTQEAAEDMMAIWNDPAVRALMTKETTLDLDDNARQYVAAWPQRLPRLAC
jgi:hypothetical protein